MKITMQEIPAGEALGGKPELWVTVQSNEILDLSRVKAAMTERQSGVFARYSPKPSHFYPALVTPKERAETGYRYDDTWAFPKIGA